MKKIWRALTFNLSQALYPLISDLYGIFEDLASSKYISAARIKEVSQNLYIVISAVMLFALGIKLISAIVNPELLDDKKKGAKKTFFRSVAALFLIVLVPMGFNKMYEWQEQIVSDHVVEKLVLGMDVSDDSNRPGQILAAYAFYSFCQPNEDVSVESISSYYNRAITEDIYYIEDLDDAITSKTNGQWDLNYHPILSPAVGFFMVYEMVVLCMDMALRGLKLALLQLITPIILCAYVIVGDDVLQKWAKEVLSTFTLVFVKIALVSFMVFGLSLIPDFFTNNNLNNTAIDGVHPIKNFLKLGIIRTFFIIGLLQLIKLLPDILNKIFGTNFKYRGGIRGRLGEMQGVGEMAQKAWDKIKGGAASLGGRAVGSLTNAAKHGLNAARKNYLENYKGKNSKEQWDAAKARAMTHLSNARKAGRKWMSDVKEHPIKNTVGRGLKNALKLSGSIGKEALLTLGAGIKAGNVSAGFKAGTERPSVKQNKGLEKKSYSDISIVNLRKLAGLEAGGKMPQTTKDDILNHSLDANGDKWTADTYMNNDHSARAKYKKASDAARVLSPIESQTAETYNLAQGNLSARKKIEDSRASAESLLDNLSDRLSNVGEEDASREIARIAADLNKDKGPQDLSKIYDDVTSGLYSTIKDPAKAESYVKGLKSLEGHQENINAHLTTLNTSFGESIKTAADLTGTTTTAELKFNDAKEAYEIVKNNASEAAKAALGELESIGNSLFKQGPTYAPQAESQESTPESSYSSTSSGGANTGTSAPQQPTRSDPYEGYGPSSTPSYGDYDGSNDYYNNGNSGGNNNGGSSDNSQGGGNTIINNNYNSGGSNDSINVKLDSSDIKDEFKNLNKSMAEMATNITNEVGKQGENISDALNDLTRSNKDIKKSVDNNTDALDDLNKNE